MKAIIKWIKYSITKKLWNEYYKHDHGFTYLETQSGKIWIGTETVLMRKNDVLCNDNELRIIDDHRRNFNIAPTPFEVMEIPQKEEEKTQAEIKL